MEQGDLQQIKIGDKEGMKFHSRYQLEAGKGRVFLVRRD